MIRRTMTFDPDLLLVPPETVMPLLFVSEADWAQVRFRLEQMWRGHVGDHPVGRWFYVVVPMCRRIVLHSLVQRITCYGREFGRGSPTRCRFLGLGGAMRHMDEITTWDCFDPLAESVQMKVLFGELHGRMAAANCPIQDDQLPNLLWVLVSTQRNNWLESGFQPGGELPMVWEKWRHKRQLGDQGTRCSHKRWQSRYGDANHVNIDQKHKFVMWYKLHTASTHDSQLLVPVRMPFGSCLGVQVDQANSGAWVNR